MLLLMSRRAALRGLGVSVALPFLESLLPPTQAGDVKTPPLRLAFVYAPNGKHMADWTPKAEGLLTEMPPTLMPLVPVRDSITVLSGLSLQPATPGMDGPGDHARAMATFLTGVRPHKTSGADVRAGVSVDQLLATSLGRATHLPSLEIGCDAARNRRDRERRSILDFVAEDARYLSDRLGGADRHRLDEYLTGIREIETRIERAQPVISIGGDRFTCPVGVPENFREHAQLLADLVTLAFQADSTRVVTFVLGNDGSNRSYREAGVYDGHHDVSHHANDPTKQEKIRRINKLHIEQLAYLLKRLQSTPEQSDTLLDHCLVVYGSGIRDGDRHDHDNLPILLAGGPGTGLVPGKGGRHLCYPAGTSLCNLYLSLLDRAGIPAQRFGDSDGRLNGLFAS
jgi:hypothetical protein